MRMTHEVTRRDFVTATVGALAGAADLPSTLVVWGPTPPADDTVVLFQGDSITDCGRDRTRPDPNAASALGSGYPLLAAAAELAAHPDRALRFYNRGVSGNKVPDLAARWATDTVALAPDVLSILIGVNDFWHKLSSGYTGTVEDYEHQYTALLDDTRRALPRTRIIVLEPFVLHCGAVDNRWFPEFDERRAAAERVARHAGATFVPLQPMFDDLARKSTPAYWAADGVHPTPAGHAAIAERWRRAAKL
jgi:lysophospholipase L1-like esterase